MADAERGQETPEEEAGAASEEIADEQDEDAPVIELAPSASPREEPQLAPDPGASAPPTQADAQPSPDNLQRMLDVPLSLTVELGGTDLQLAEVLKLRPGSVVEIDRLPGEPIDLLVNGSLFAKGEVVVINDTFGYRITQLVQHGTTRVATDLQGE